MPILIHTNIHKYILNYESFFACASVIFFIRVNIRLAGDTSEDPAFPKLVFPQKEFCAKCYNDMTGYLKTLH